MNYIYSKDDGDKISEIYLIWSCTSQTWFLVCSYCISFFTNLEGTLRKSIFYLFFVNAWHFSMLCPWLWWNRQNLLGFHVFEPLFIEGWYCRKYFPFMMANTSTRVIVKGVVTSSGNVKWSLMLPLVTPRRFLSGSVYNLSHKE